MDALGGRWGRRGFVSCLVCPLLDQLVLLLSADEVAWNH